MTGGKTHLSEEVLNRLLASRRQDDAPYVVWVGRPKSALLEPVKVPEVTVEAAIERSSWRVPEGGTLLELPGPEYFPTTPARLPWGYGPFRPSWTPFPSPWEPIDYPGLIGGLPEV